MKQNPPRKKVLKGKHSFHKTRWSSRTKIPKTMRSLKVEEARDRVKR